jgi:hypothetical protein
MVKKEYTQRENEDSVEYFFRLQDAGLNISQISDAAYESLSDDKRTELGERNSCCLNGMPYLRDRNGKLREPDFLDYLVIL